MKPRFLCTKPPQLPHESSTIDLGGIYVIGAAAVIGTFMVVGIHNSINSKHNRSSNIGMVLGPYMIYGMLYGVLWPIAVPYVFIDHIATITKTIVLK